MNTPESIRIDIEGVDLGPASRWAIDLAEAFVRDYQDRAREGVSQWVAYTQGAYRAVVYWTYGNQLVVRVLPLGAEL